MPTKENYKKHVVVRSLGKYQDKLVWWLGWLEFFLIDKTPHKNIKFGKLLVISIRYVYKTNLISKKYIKLNQGYLALH